MKTLDPKQFPRVDISEFDDFPQALKVTLPDPVIAHLQELAEERMKVKRVGASYNRDGLALSVRNQFEGLCGEYAVASLIPGLLVNVEHYVDGGDGGKGDLSIDDNFNIGVKTRDWYGQYPTSQDSKSDFKDTFGVLVWRFNGNNTPMEHSVNTPNQFLVVGFFTREDWEKYSERVPSFGRWIIPTRHLRHMKVLIKLAEQYQENKSLMPIEEVYAAVGLEPPKPDSEPESESVTEDGADD